MSRSALALVVAFAILAAGVWILQTTNPAAPEGAPLLAMDLPETDVQRIEVTTPRGSAAFERVDPFGWKFAGTDNPADFNRVSSVVNRLAKLRAQAKVLDKVTDLSQYGLAQPTVATTLTLKDGSTRRILFGAKTVNDAAYYAMPESTMALYTVSTLVVTDAEKLVTEPPIPTPTPGGPTLTPTITRTPTITPTPFGTATPTLGIPLPNIQLPTATPTPEA
jgi:hypothetical protein